MPNNERTTDRGSRHDYGMAAILVVAATIWALPVAIIFYDLHRVWLLVAPVPVFLIIAAIFYAARGMISSFIGAHRRQT